MKSFFEKVNALGLERKINKFKKDPELFVKDMLLKRSIDPDLMKLLKKSSHNKYTVVSAIYNVEKYLDEYFESIVKQSLDFKKHIELICVDDGSTDNSAEIIRKWQKKYPKNIIYKYKENGGQSSARNLGLTCVKTDWVTFIDPDDFISYNYFSAIDENIVANENLNMVVSYFKFYIEKFKIYKDNHPLKYRYNAKNKLVKSNDLNDNINLSVATTFFKTKTIQNNNLIFDSKIKPNFEDGKFIADYLRVSEVGDVLFVKEAIYNYRKRAESNSTLDKAWIDKRKYSNVLEYGFLQMLKEYKKQKGYVPKHIQRTVLYDMSWYIKYLLNEKEKINFLSDRERNKFRDLMSEIFKYIDEDQIYSFNLAGVWFFHKIGMLGYFKNSSPKFQIAYVENIDNNKRMILLKYYSFFKKNISIKVEGKEVMPFYQKVRVNEFIGDDFIYENRLWIPFENLNDSLKLYIDNMEATINVKNEKRNIVTFQEVSALFEKSNTYKENDPDLWLFMDRDAQADDNAEHLYRYIKNSNLNKKCFFALKKESPDWLRLKVEGFNLIDFGSQEFEEILTKAGKVISSQLDNYVYNYFKDEYCLSKQFVFLQHGIIKEDLSSWINGKQGINLFVTSTEGEYKSITEGETYNLTEKEVVLTGLPRHDRFNDIKRKSTKKTIIVMPTWRKNIVGQSVGMSTKRTLNKEFLSSKYFISWKSFFHNPLLENLVKESDYKIVFMPHLNIEPYLNFFELPDYIDTWIASESETSIQEMFVNSDLLITDYSSVAFEMGILRKSVLYYQFDKEEILNGSHTYKPGYFAYENDGFGPVCENESDLLKQFQLIVNNDFKIEDNYLKRINNTFKINTERNCERVVSEIIKLDDKASENLNEINYLKEFIELAEVNADWKSMLNRTVHLRSLVKINSKDFKYAMEKNLSAIAYMQDWNVLEKSIKSQKFIEYQILSYMGQCRWQEALDLLSLVASNNLELSVMQLNCFSELGEHSKALKVFNNINSKFPENIYKSYCDLLVCLSDRYWSKIISTNVDIQQLIDNRNKINPYFNFCINQILVLKARALRHHRKFNEAVRVLDYDKTNSLNIQIEKCKLFILSNNKKKGFDLFDKILMNFEMHQFSLETLIFFADALFEYEYWSLIYKVLPKIIESFNDVEQFKVIYLYSLIQYSEWEKILELSKEISDKDSIIIPLTFAKFRTGSVQEAYELCNYPPEDASYDYWKLVSEMAILEKDKATAEKCLKFMLSKYPDRDREENWQLFNSII